MAKRCFLKCLSDLHEPILLLNSKPHIFGRMRETKIKDKKCSKEQVELTADYEEYVVKYKHLGQSNGGFKGSFIKAGELHNLIHEDTFEFVFGHYPHQIVFDPAPQLKEESPNHESLSSVKKIPEKRKHDLCEESSMKKLCSIGCDEKRWESLFGGDLLVYNQHGLKSNKIAAYDLDGTLITTMSGRVFPKDSNDWKIIYAEVPGKLKQLYHDGYKIVIFTNQLGVSKGKTTVNSIQTKISRVMEKLSVPIQVFVSTNKGKYRKPSTEMWNFCIQECNGDEVVDVDMCLYVGDAAGRLEVAKVRKKDHSVSDRLFALNIGMSFYTPEEHFMGHKSVAFKMPDFIPKEIDSAVSLYEPASTKVPNYPLEVILLVGFPASGKSTFVEKHLLKEGYLCANRDTFGSWQKCVNLMEKSIRVNLDSEPETETHIWMVLEDLFDGLDPDKEGRHVVIDNTNPDRASRARYTQVALKEKVPIRCFVMNVSHAQALHNNKFRELTGSDHSNVSEMIFNFYKSKYEEPSLKEGFTDIVKINFVPFFKTSDQEKLYKQFLVEK